MTEKQSFWSSIPKIMTGFAAIITAIGGLLLALSQTGIIGNNGPPKANNINTNNEIVNQSATKNTQTIAPKESIIAPIKKEFKKTSTIKVVQKPLSFSGHYTGTSTEGMTRLPFQLKLVRQRNTVTGTYIQSSESGYIQGIVEGNTLTYQWSVAGEAGLGRVTINGDKIEGTWGYGHSNVDGGTAVAWRDDN